MNLSKNFTLAEMLESGTARRLLINEQFSPPKDVVEKLEMLCKMVLQPLREHFGTAIKVNSGYRCPELNLRIGGVMTSQHLKGEAADIAIGGISTLEICEAVKKLDLDFDQCIEEYGSWVHISYKKGRNRRMTLQKKHGEKYQLLKLS